MDFAQLRSELQTLDKNEFTTTKNEHDRLTVEIEKLRQRFREEVSKIQASVRLDLNLEKGRIRDESSVHELKIKETDNRIEYPPILRGIDGANGRQEIGLMKAQMESAKFQVIQWLVTIAMSAGALGLGILPFLYDGRANGSLCSIVQLKLALCL